MAGYVFTDLFTRGTGAGTAIDNTITASGILELKEVRVHLNAASGTSENFVVAIDSTTGTTYDAVLAKQDMNALTDYVWRPTPSAMISSGDSLTFNWTNTNQKTWGLEVVYRQGNDTALTF